MHAKDKRKDNETKTKCSTFWRNEQKTKQGILYIGRHPRAIGCKMK